MPLPLINRRKGKKGTEPLLSDSARFSEIEEYHIPELGTKELSLAHIMGLNFAPWTSKAFSIFIILSETICLAAYCSIFASSFASNVPIGSFGTCAIY
ncbi:MAG: hypothetical protein V2I33_22905, partial [Kangiellaceae bacterium]|nr:hypothetical protein [Kangiellaceae bacterium]